MAREIKMLILGKMLIGEDQDRVFCKRFFDCQKVGGIELPRQVDIANFSSEAWRDWIERYGHIIPLQPEIWRS